MKGKTKGAGQIIGNLFYWLRVLYRDSPGYVLLYLVGAPLAIGISWLGAYMPSALVEDITAGEAAFVTFRNLALLGGALTLLYGAQRWAQETRKRKEKRICGGHSMRLIKETLNAEYRNTERPDFHTEFMKLQELHLWSGDLTDRFLTSMASGLEGIAGLLIYAGMLSGLSPWILVLIVVSAVVSSLVGAWCNRWDSKNRHKWWALDLKMEYLAQNMSSYQSAKDVHLYSMAPWLRKLYDRELKERMRYTARLMANFYVWGVSYSAAAMICEGASYLYLIYCVCTGQMSAADFVLYVGILIGFTNWCYSLEDCFKSLHEIALYVEEDRKFRGKLAREKEEGKEALVWEKGHIPEIVFRDVTFRYEGAKEPVIKHLNLTMKPGENLALVGLNGAGKTTFIKLLCGFYDPTEGEILVDGVNRSRYTKESWIRCFSGVFQETGLFPLTLRENLMPEGKEDSRRVKECLELADLKEKLEKLPEGLDTLFGAGVLEGAADFSGGEVQKLMLARALYKQAPFLVLDEPTAALDPLAESELYEKYYRLSKEKTTVFISHRLASTRFCDRILLLENGKVTESGTHRELMEKQGSYAAMYRLQSKYYQQAEAGLEGDMEL